MTEDIVILYRKTSLRLVFKSSSCDIHHNSHCLLEKHKSIISYLQSLGAIDDGMIDEEEEVG